MANISVEELYQLIEDIDKNKKDGKSSENAALYTRVIEATKGDSQAKRLSAQFIARLFKEFPTEQRSMAYDAMFDLIDNSDAAIRKQAISQLPKLCKDDEEFTARVADVLVQAMQTEDERERSLLHQTLLQVISQHPHRALTGIFGLMSSEQCPAVARQRCLRLLATRLQHVPLTPQLEEFLHDRIVELVDTASEAEFQLCFQILCSQRRVNTLEAKQKIYGLLCEQANIGHEFSINDSADVARLVTCSVAAVRILPRNLSSEQFIRHYCNRVLPTLVAERGGEGEGKGKGGEGVKEDALNGDANQATSETAAASASRREILLRAFADLTTVTGSGYSASLSDLQPVSQLLVSGVPSPSQPIDESRPIDASTSPTAEPTESNVECRDEEMPALNLSECECLLASLLNLARTNRALLTGDGMPMAEQLREAASRLVRVTDAYHSKLSDYKRRLRQAEAEGDNADALARAKRRRELVDESLRVTQSVSALATDLLQRQSSSRRQTAALWRPADSCDTFWQTWQTSTTSTAGSSSPSGGVRRRRGGEGENGGGGSAVKRRLGETEAGRRLWRRR